MRIEGMDAADGTHPQLALKHLRIGKEKLCGYPATQSLSAVKAIMYAK
jgi:hypothetical protein